MFCCEVVNVVATGDVSVYNNDVDGIIIDNNVVVVIDSCVCSYVCVSIWRCVVSAVMISGVAVSCVHVVVSVVAVVVVSIYVFFLVVSNSGVYIFVGNSDVCLCMLYC